MANRDRSRQKDILLTILAIAVVVLIVVLVFGNKNKDKSPNTGTNSNTDTTAIAPSGVKYPAGWQESSEITLTDKAAGVISEASRDIPKAQVIVRVENVGRPEDFDINKTLDDTAQKLDNTLDNFSLIEKKVIQLGPYQAMSLKYSYSSGGLNYQQNQIIIPTDKKTYYLTITATADSFKQIESDLDKISAALASYINAH